MKKKNKHSIRKVSKILKAKTLDKLLDAEYGKKGTRHRDKYDHQARQFILSETLRETRRSVKMTQQQLADKTGTQKSYISKLEHGDCDIQLSTLYRIFEVGLGKRIALQII